MEIIAQAINEALDMHPSMKGYIFLVRYDHNKIVNDFFSSLSDIRVIWGGDHTISEVRKSPLRSRSTEITFADRFSMAVIDSTYFLDQNACTSPRIIVWLGDMIEEAKELFWKELHSVVKIKYSYQGIQGVNKLTSAFVAAAGTDGINILSNEDNLIFRLQVNHLDDELIKYMDNSGFFFEYDCDDITELFDLCNNNKCQTIGYIGNKGIFTPLLSRRPKGIDRIIPVGHTMDFDLIWDGYNLIDIMSRTIYE